MARFTSEFKGLILQDGPSKPGADTPEPWARFVDGAFETEDSKVVGRLRKVDYVTEVKADEAKANDDAGDSKKD